MGTAFSIYTRKSDLVPLVERMLINVIKISLGALWKKFFLDNYSFLKFI